MPSVSSDRLLALCSPRLLSASRPTPPPRPIFRVLSDDPGAWPAILSSIGLQPQPAALARIFVARTGAAASTEWTARVERRRHPDPRRRILARRYVRLPPQPRRTSRSPASPTSTAPPSPSSGRKVSSSPASSSRRRASLRPRALDRRPMTAGFRRGAGAVLWVAVPPGERGYERFPYLLNASPISASNRRSGRTASGPSSIPPTAPASISITSPPAGAKPASPPCTSPPGTSTNPTPQQDAYLNEA